MAPISIQAFKGLEAPVVVITDVEGLTDTSVRALMNIGVTRTLGRMLMLISGADREIAQGLVKR